MDLPLFKASIPRLVAFQRAVLEGTTVAELKDPRGQQGWEEYRRVGKETEQLVTRQGEYMASSASRIDVYLSIWQKTNSPSFLGK